MKRILFAILLSPLLLVGCSGDDGPKAEDVALQAAKAYYDQLLHGDYDSFVEGSLKGDSIPAAYKQQLVLNAKMFVEDQQKAHQGVKTVETLRASCDTVKDANGTERVLAETFLSLLFADGVKEEVMVPMELKDGIWYMR